MTLGCNHTIHKSQSHFGWDNAITPRLMVATGDTVEFKTVDSSGGQLTAASTVTDIAKLDFGKVNPVSGPIYVHDAEPGDAIKVTVLGYAASGWGWTASIP
ncbi:MAG: acetamidase/formamidase family protein, partial [Alphaproteobacteria bacterium]